MTVKFVTGFGWRRMGRRLQHTQEELEELILKAARKGVEEGAGVRPSVRDIAREIGYAPGTLYNVFPNLADIMLRVEAKVLDEFDRHVADAIEGRRGDDALRHFISAYVEFAYKNARLWRLVQEQHPAVSRPSPDWYLERLYGPLSRLEAIVAKMNGGCDADEVVRTARVVWSAIHGVAHVATTAKFGVLPSATAIDMAQRLVEAYMESQSHRLCSREGGRHPPKS